MAYLDKPGLDALWEKVKNWTNSVHAHSMTKGASSQDGLQLMLKNGAQSPTTLSTVTITKSDVTALGIPSSDTTYTDATQSAHGLMSAADKKKLDGVEANANHYVHPTSAAGAKASGLYKVATDAQGHVTGATAVTKSDITALGIPGSQPTVPDVPEWVDNPKGSDITLDAGIAGVTDGSTVSEGMNEHGESIAANAAAIAGKQDTIADLATIRSGAAKGATALQSVPSTYRTAAQQDAIHDSTKADKASPAFTGTPTAPTAAAGTNTTRPRPPAALPQRLSACSPRPRRAGTGSSRRLAPSLARRARSATWCSATPTTPLEPRAMPISISCRTTSRRFH